MLTTDDGRQTTDDDDGRQVIAKNDNSRATTPEQVDRFFRNLAGREILSF